MTFLVCLLVVTTILGALAHIRSESRIDRLDEYVRKSNRFTDESASKIEKRVEALEKTDNLRRLLRRTGVVKLSTKKPEGGAV